MRDTFGTAFERTHMTSYDPTADLQALDALEMKLFARSYAMTDINFAGETVDPPKGAAARGEALAILSEESHELLCAPEVGEVLARLGAHADQLDEMRAAQVRVLTRDRDQSVTVPAKEEADYTRLVNEAIDVWHRAKPAGDWDSFEPYVDRIVETMRRFAGYKDATRDPYDVWLDEFEIGMSRAFYDRFFEQVKECVIPLVADVCAKGWQPSLASFQGHFDPACQWELARDIVELEGLDMDALVIGKTEHPFTDSAVSGHAFIASHVHEEDVISNVYSMLHEGGHALYEQGVNPAFDYNCLGGGISMGIHESQSRFFENIVGRSEAFAGPLLGLMQKRFPEQLGHVDPHEFFLAVNRSEPSLVRTEADELTYALHIIIRYEIEQLLFAGEAKASDVPRLWAERYKSYLGVDVPNHTCGALQDTHWAGGMFGYFPTYALGSAYASQYHDKMVAEGMDFDGLLAAGDLAPIRAWLHDRIWQYGRSKDPEELVLIACGEPFDASHYTRYLTEKFSAIYGL